MSFEFLPDWIYTFLILPIVVLAQRHYSNSSRITVIENKEKIDDQKLEKLCNSVDNLTKEVHELIGQYAEHTRN